MTVPYTLKFKGLSYESVPNDTTIKFQVYLSDSNNLPFMSGNQIDLITVSTTKSSLPALPANYQTFFESVIASFIYNKYSFSTPADTVYNSQTLSGVDITNVKVGMSAVTTPTSYVYSMTSYSGYPYVRLSLSTDTTASLYIGMSISGTGVTAGTLISEILTGSVARTANTTSASTTLSNIDTTDLFPGMKIVGPNIPADARVATIVSATSLTMSSAATATQTNVTIVLDQNNFIKMSANASSSITTNYTFSTGIQSNTTVTKILSNDSIEISLAANGTITDLSVLFNTNNWLIDYSSVSQILSLIDHSNL